MRIGHAALERGVAHVEVAPRFRGVPQHSVVPDQARSVPPNLSLRTWVDDDPRAVVVVVLRAALDVHLQVRDRVARREVAQPIAARLIRGQVLVRAPTVPDAPQRARYVSTCVDSIVVRSCVWCKCVCVCGV